VVVLEILEPSWQCTDDGDGIWFRVNAEIVAPEGFDEGLADGFAPFTDANGVINKPQQKVWRRLRLCFD
jgi:hypothetical protein